MEIAEIALLVLVAAVVGGFIFCFVAVLRKINREEKEAIERIKKLKPTNEKTIVII